MTVVFEWDDGNWPKCGKHGLTKEDIESAFAHRSFVVLARGERDEVRFNAVGITKQGRHAFVAFTLRGDRIRPISARFMHQREIENYVRQRGAETLPHP